MRQEHSDVDEDWDGARVTPAGPEPTVAGEMVGAAADEPADSRLIDSLDCSAFFENVAPPARSPTERLMSPLTRRELEVVGLMCDGWSNEEISKATGLALSTIKYHFVNVFGKLGVRRRTQAVAVVIHLGLVRPSWLMGTRLPIGEHARTTKPLRQKNRTISAPTAGTEQGPQ